MSDTPEPPLSDRAQQRRRVFTGIVVTAVFLVLGLFLYLNVVYLNQMGASDLRGTDPIEFRKQQEAIQTGPSGSVSKSPPTVSVSEESD